MDRVKFTTYLDHITQETVLMIRLDTFSAWSREAVREIFHEAIEKAAKQLAADFIQQRGTEVMAKLSPEAVANLAVAKAGAQICRSLERLDLKDSYSEG